MLKEIKLLKPQEVADRLGLSLATVYRLIDSGRLQVVKIGSALRVDDAEVRRLVTACTETRGRARRHWRSGA